MMPNFGWSYPPGCSGPPEADTECYSCGAEMNWGICDECGAENLSPYERKQRDLERRADDRNDEKWRD